MQEISGDYWFGEARGANWLLSRRVTGFGLWTFLLFLVVICASEFAASTLVELLAPPWLSAWLSLPAIAAVGGGGLFAWLRWRRGSLRKGWLARGISDPTSMSFRLENEVFVLKSPAQEIRCQWAVISEIAPSKRHWVYIGAGLGYCVPRRLFPDLEAERAFLRESLERMSEAARGRSQRAVSFAARGEGT